MHTRRGVTIIELLVVICIFCAMVLLLTPFVKMARVRAHRINCANNLRQISLGLHGYAAEHNDMLPAELNVLYPNYISNDKVFDCPASRTIGTSQRPDYKYKAGLAEGSSPKEIVSEDLDGNHGKAGKNMLRLNGAIEWSGNKL